MIKKRPQNVAPFAQSPKVLPLGSWKGVRDVGDADANDPAFLQDAINCYFPDPRNGAAVEARPGFTKATSAGLNSNAKINCLHSVPFMMFAVAGSKVYRSTNGSTWTDVTPVGPTIALNVPVYAVTYNGEIIFTDGTNKPWRATNLASTPITGTNIEINSTASAWATRGAPTVYGGKLFFIVASIASTVYTTRMVWSEEADASLGYLQTGYTNNWDLIQTSQDTLTALCGTDNGLYYFRINSIGLITGAVNATFQTSSTHDSVSQKIGVFALKSVLLANGYLWWLSYEGLLHRVAVGSRNIENLSDQLRNRIRKIQATNTVFAQNTFGATTAYVPELHKVVVAGWMAESASGAYAPSRNLYVFDADTGSYEGRWMIGLASQPASETPNVVQVGSPDASPGGGVVYAGFDVFGTDLVGRVTLWVSGTDTAGNQGFIWRLTPKSIRVFGDDSAAMHMSITTMLAPNDQNVESRIQELAVDLVPDNVAVSLDYYTPRGSSLALTATGVANNDSIQSSHDHGRAVFGLNGLGRWFRAVLNWNVPSGSAPYAFERASVKVQPQKAGSVVP